MRYLGVALIATAVLAWSGCKDEKPTAKQGASVGASAKRSAPPPEPAKPPGASPLGVNDVESVCNHRAKLKGVSGDAAREAEFMERCLIEFDGYLSRCENRAEVVECNLKTQADGEDDLCKCKYKD
jgi:hypothetical protein